MKFTLPPKQPIPNYAQGERESLLRDETAIRDNVKARQAYAVTYGLHYDDLDDLGSVCDRHLMERWSRLPAPAPVNTSGLVNPYTMEEERLWQSIVGSELATPEHVAAFELATGKQWDQNYLV